MKHHVWGAETLFSSEDVVPGDEGIRAGSEAPRPGAEDSFSSGDVVPGDEGIRASRE